MKPISFLAASAAIVACAHAAIPRDFVVDLKAATSTSAPYLTLSWGQRVQTNISSQKIHRRLKGDATWVKQADLLADQTSWADPTALPGVEYEYWMERRLTGLSPSVAMGYLSAGALVPEVHDRGRLLLVIDDTMVTPLAAEIAQLRADLAADGWTVRTVPVPRTGTAVSTKALIKAARDEAPVQTRCVFLLGRVPVPYSGYLAPDAHEDHYGAWPTDAYYGDMDGTWTDATVNNTEASSSRNDNIPGDGKFDQSSLPSTVELEVGRVDFSGITKAPSAGVSEATLLRRYLRKDHQFRHRIGTYADIPRRSIIRDGFGHFTSAEPFAVQGWATALSAVGTTIDQPASGQWFTGAYASGQDYLFGYGCGGGSYTSASTFGTTLDYGMKASRVVFTGLFGSYFGDWDSTDNLMRASIAGTASGDSLGLVCFWSGRPNWVAHHTGMGETWGYVTRASMNAAFPTASPSYAPLGYSSRGVHLGLMGDPALRMHIVAPPRGLAATSSSGNVTLTWAASTESGVTGYHVYRGASPEGPFTRLTGTALSTPGYTDATAPAGQASTYLVKTVKLESVPGGSYHNLSTGAAATITPSAAPASAPANPSDLAATSDNPAIVLAGFHAFLASSTADESADQTAPGFSSTITKSTDSRNGGGSDDIYYGSSNLAAGGSGDGFLRMTGPFTLSVTHGGTADYDLDALYLDATSISTGALLNVSYSVNGGASVPIASSLALPVSTASDTEVRAYGDFRLALDGVTLRPGDTIIFSADLGAGGGRLDNLALAGRIPAPGNHVYLSWQDNSSNETGFRVERKMGAAGTYTTIATLPAGTTSYADTLNSGTSIATYRIIATGSADSIASGETIFEPAAGLIAFDDNVAAYDKRTGTATIAVTRAYGSFGAVTANFATSNSSATAGTHYTTTSGTLSWADGEGGTKSINVPILASPHATPRQFKVTLSSLTGGAGLGLLSVTSALIQDPSATLDAPWISGSFGSPSHLSPAVSAEGGIADSVIGGTAAGSGVTAESGRFIHQERTGDGSIVIRVRGSSPSQSAARFGVMIRSSLATNSPMAAILASSSTSAGTRAMHRLTSGAATVVPSGNGNANSTVAPCWVRLTRVGDVFVSEISSDGNAWTLLASQSIPGISATAFWGIYHCSSGISATTLQGDWHMAIYENVNLGPAVAPPSPVAFTLAAGPAFTWESHPLAASYRLERGGDDGSENVISDLTGSVFTDTTAAADTAYEYRLSAVNSGGTSAATAFQRIVTPPVAGGQPLRPGFLQSLPSPGSGVSLSWFDPPAGETSIVIERRAAYGDWTPLHTAAPDTTSFMDASVLPGVYYHYRIRNLVSGTPSSWATRTPISSSPAVIAPGIATGYRLWLLANELPMDESGAGQATASPDGGTLKNLVKYALGLPGYVTSHGNRLSQATVESSGQLHGTFSYTRPDPAPASITYVVESSADLSEGSWTSSGLTLAGESTTGLQYTATWRSTAPIGQAPLFFRLRVVKGE